MNSRAKITVVLAMLGIFVAGTVVGGFGTTAWRRHARSQLTAREFSERHFQHVVDYLELTDEQVERVRPMMAEFADQIRAVRRESFGEVREVFREMNAHLEAELTPEQLVKHHEFLEKQRARFDRAAKRRGDDRRSGNGAASPGGNEAAGGSEIDPGASGND
jgi:hypothetical protein